MGYLGYSIVAGDYDGSVSQAVTVPNNATFCLAYIGGDEIVTFSSVSLGGTAMDSVVVGGGYGTNRMWSCACASGSSTFAYSASGGFSNGGAAVLLFFSDVSGVRSSYGAGLSSLGTLTLSQITSVAGDIAVIVGFHDNYSSPGVMDVTGNGQTEIVKTGSYNNRGYGAAYLVAAGTTVGMQIYGDWVQACEVVLIPIAAETLTQHSFQVFNDDGSESASTAKAAINTNVNLSASDIARVRFLIDATSDPAGRQFQLEYRRKPSGGSFGPWTKVNN